MRPATAAVAAELSWPQVHAFRLRRHHLHQRAAGKDLIGVAGDICGAQAQVMSAAELQLAVRVECTTGAVREALWKDRSLVKTWLMRGTLHLLPAGDLPVFTAAMNGSWAKPRPSWFEYFGLRERDLAQLTETITGALDGEPMTREQIIAVAGKGQSRQVLEWMKSGWGGFLKPVARAGRLCFGPSRGQSVTFVNPREWLGAWRDLEPEEALVEVARRYLRAYGPATRKDFEAWFGRWPGVAAIAWSGLESELVTVAVGGAPMQILSADLKHIPASPLPGTMRLLPAFDPFLMGHSSRSHLFDAGHRAKVSRTSGWISQVVLVDGEVHGVWRHELLKRTLRVVVEEFGRLPATAKAEIGLRAQEIAAALGAERAQVTFSRPAKPGSRSGGSPRAGAASAAASSVRG